MKNPFNPPAATENQYARQLRKIASEVGRIVTGYEIGSSSLEPLLKALGIYSEIIRPWAVRQADIMLNAADRSNGRAWEAYSREMSNVIKRQLRDTATGELHAQLLQDQVGLITSLPIEAGKRVVKLTHEGLAGSSRGAALTKEIMRTGEVTKSRATLIARTETSRANTEYTKLRAMNVGSEYFKWNTAHDADVRPSHKALDGKLFRWAEPPLCDEPNHHSLPGCIWNCRCLALPILPDEDEF